jgi:DNA-directed RNA polymerase subunit RPC12/RpoP
LRPAIPDRNERGNLEGVEHVERTPFGPLELDPELSVFAPENPDNDMHYTGLRCPCGGVQFRLWGRLSVAFGQGGYFWRTLTRFLREARQPMQVEECPDSPVIPPLFLRCEACRREFTVLDNLSENASSHEAGRDGEREEPEESLRCRVCSSGRFELVAGVSRDESSAVASIPGAAEIISHCHRCRRQTRIAWFRSTVSEQEIRLDLLYGRR